jgi:pimeloyl-ACP methyl ester carboxylesterase
VQVIEEIKTEPWLFPGQAFAAATPEVTLVGHSWGGMAATLAAPLAVKSNVLIVRSLVTSATPTGFGDIFAPLITAQAAAELPVGTSADAIAMAASQNIAVFKWALEPADPMFAVSTYPAAANLAVLNQLVETGTTDVDLHGTADQERLRAAFNRASAAEVTFTTAGANGANICDEPELAVGSLLKPCVELTTSASYPQAAGAYAAMQRQLVTFIATPTHVVCSPNYATPCP